MKYKLIASLALVALGSIFSGSYETKFIQYSRVNVPKPYYVKSKSKGWL